MRTVNAFIFVPVQSLATGFNEYPENNVIHQVKRIILAKAAELNYISNMTQRLLFQSLLFFYPADPGDPADAYLSSCSLWL